jgi:hypothetical protein
MVYQTEESGGDLGTAGSFRVFAPEVAGLEKDDNYVPVLKLTMQLWLIKEYMYFPFGGNMRHLTGQPKSAWSWLRSLFFPPDTRTPFIVRQLADEIKYIRQRSGGGEMSSTGERLGDAYASHLLLKGKGGGWTAVTYMSPKLYYLIDILFFLAGAFGLYALGRWTPLSKSGLAVGALVLAAFLGAALPSVWEDFMNAVFIGVVLTSVVWLVCRIVGLMQSSPGSMSGIPPRPGSGTYPANPGAVPYGVVSEPSGPDSSVDMEGYESPPDKRKARRGRPGRKGGE